MIEPLYAISGLGVGLLVGMTGVGGGSLMTPLLILLFGLHPATAVGTDLLFAATTKTAGSLLHGLARNIDWAIVRRLATGSLPAAIVTLCILSRMDLNAEVARDLITIVLCVALVATAVLVVLRDVIANALRARLGEVDPRVSAATTVLVGALVGVLVSISSVGAGAIGFMALVVLYPKHPIARLVGSDIAHAVPLTLVAGLGHWLIGTVDWHIMVSLLAGSLPGIVLGSYLAIRVPEPALRIVLALTLLAVAGRLGADQLSASSSIMTAFTRRAIH